MPTARNMFHPKRKWTSRLCEATKINHEVTWRTLRYHRAGSPPSVHPKTSEPAQGQSETHRVIARLTQSDQNFNTASNCDDCLLWTVPMVPSHLVRTFSRCMVDRKFVSTLVRDGTEIRCCGDLYKSWTNSNLKPHLPKPKKPDLRMHIEYLRSPKRSGKLTVLAFHGSPGNAEHFRTLGDTMNKLCGADFIVPSFPDVSYTIRTGEFYHSAEEKVEMVEALLQKLGISEVDLILAHSAGSQPALLMTAKQKNIRIRSIALLCSTTHMLIPAYQPTWLHPKLLAPLHIPGFRRLIIPAYKMVTLSLGLKKMSALEAATSLATAYATRYWYPGGIPGWMADLSRRGIPRMAMYSSRDFVVPKRISEEFVKVLGNPDKANHYVYNGKTDADLRQVHKPLNTNLPPVVHFIDGGHNVITQFPLTVADHILRFVRTQVPHNKLVNG